MKSTVFQLFGIQNLGFPCQKVGLKGRFVALFMRRSLRMAPRVELYTAYDTWAMKSYIYSQPVCNSPLGSSK